MIVRTLKACQTSFARLQRALFLFDDPVVCGPPATLCNASGVKTHPPATAGGSCWGKPAFLTKRLSDWLVDRILKAC